MMNDLLSKRSIRLVLLLLIVIFMVGIQTWKRRSSLAETPAMGTMIAAPEPGGTLTNAGTAPAGDLKSGVAALKHFYHFAEMYRTRHGGIRPTGAAQMFADLQAFPENYGFRDKGEMISALTLPDSSAIPSRPYNTSRTLPYDLRFTRLDGQPIGAKKTLGQRDILAYSTQYFHENMTVYPHHAATANPSGYYLALWDDGSVEKIPFEKIRLVSMQDPSADRVFKAKTGLDASTIVQNWVVGFPGEAGVPDGSISGEEYYRKLFPSQTK